MLQAAWCSPDCCASGGTQAIGACLKLLGIQKTKMWVGTVGFRKITSWSTWVWMFADKLTQFVNVTIWTAPNWLIEAHNLLGMRACIAEVMTNMDVKKLFGQHIFSVFSSAAKVALLVLRLQPLHWQLWWLQVERGVDSDLMRDFTVLTKICLRTLCSSVLWRRWDTLMAVLYFVPGILYLTQPPAMTRARQCLCRRPQKLWSELSIAKWENPVFREFLEALCRYKLIPTSCWPNLAPWKMQLVIFWQSSAFFPAWAGHDIVVRHFIPLQPPTPGAVLLPLFNDIFAGAASKPSWRAGAAPRSPQIPAQPVRSICNCPDSPWWALLFWAGASGAQKSMKSNLLLGYLAGENQQYKYL